jgi:hypothetical protein
MNAQLDKGVMERRNRNVCVSAFISPNDLFVFVTQFSSCGPLPLVLFFLPLILLCSMLFYSIECFYHSIQTKERTEERVSAHQKVQAMT